MCDEKKAQVKTRLEIGCGVVEKPEDDVLYLDMKPFPGVHVVRDIERGLPFGDMVFREVKAHHVLEHVHDLIFVMNEIHRVMEVGGILDVEVPYGCNAMIDPTHVRFFDMYGFNFFIHRDFNSVNAGVKGWFEPVSFDRKGPSETDIRGLRFVMRKVVLDG